MKILVVDDHPIVLSGLTTLLVAEPDLEVLTSRDGEAALAILETASPDLFIIDVNLPGLSGFDLTKRIVAWKCNARIIVFSMNDDPIMALKALECGAAGFISKNGDPEQFVAAIRQVFAGDYWLPKRIAEQMALARAGVIEAGPELTERELRIVRLLAHGKSATEIAEELKLSYKTVYNETTSVCAKLRARSPLDMIRIAAQSKII